MLRVCSLGSTQPSTTGGGGVGGNRGWESRGEGVGGGVGGKRKGGRALRGGEVGLPVSRVRPGGGGSAASWDSGTPGSGGTEGFVGEVKGGGEVGVG